MRRRAIVWSVLSSSVVLAAGWQLGYDPATPTSTTATDAAGTSSTPETSTDPSTATSTTAPPTTTAPATTAPLASTAPTGVSGTFTGSSVSTRYGSVQVQIVVADGSITDVVALKLTDDDNRSVSISNRAAPVLRKEVLSAQSAKVQSVSGATYTSDGYLTSLQSALDQAGL